MAHAAQLATVSWAQLTPNHPLQTKLQEQTAAFPRSQWRMAQMKVACTPKIRLSHPAASGAFEVGSKPERRHTVAITQEIPYTKFCASGSPVSRGFTDVEIEP